MCKKYGRRGKPSLGSPRAKNDKSNKRIIRFKKRNGKFAKVRRIFRKGLSTFDDSAWDVICY